MGLERHILEKKVVYKLIVKESHYGNLDAHSSKDIFAYCTSAKKKG